MANSYEATGRIIVIGTTITLMTASGKEFKKRDLVIEVEDGNYPQQVKFQLTQDRCDILEKFKVEETVTVCFNLRGKPNVKDGVTSYFVNLDAWRIIKPERGTPRDRTNDFDDVPF